MRFSRLRVRKPDVDKIKKGEMRRIEAGERWQRCVIQAINTGFIVCKPIVIPRNLASQNSEFFLLRIRAGMGAAS